MTSRAQRFAKRAEAAEGRKPLQSRPPAPARSRRSVDVSDLPDLMSRLSKDQDLWAIDEVTVRLAGVHPTLCYQALAKFRDRTRAWAVWVADDPAVALAEVLRLAAKGPDFAEKNSIVRFFDNKMKADEHGTKIQEQNADLVRTMHVEFEPYMGYVAVMFLFRDGDREEAHKRFGLLCEIRTPSQTHPARNRHKTDGFTHQSRAGGTAPSGNPRNSSGSPTRTAPKDGNPGGGSNGRTPAKNKGVAASPPVVSARPTREELMPQKKSALIKIHQGLYGKQPNNKLSVEEIVDLILSKLPKE